ncbi:hypothetical protein ABEF95_014612 [Exophiala dermatitidis]
MKIPPLEGYGLEMIKWTSVEDPGSFATSKQKSSTARSGRRISYKNSETASGLDQQPWDIAAPVSPFRSASHRSSSLIPETDFHIWSPPSQSHAPSYCIPDLADDVELRPRSLESLEPDERDVSDLVISEQETPADDRSARELEEEAPPDSQTVDANPKFEESIPEKPFQRWIIDNTLTTFLSHVLETPGEEIAYHYYFKHVSSFIPAYDGQENPYRKLCVVTLSYPVLLQTVISIATEHMFNFGRSNADLVASRQFRALKSLQAVISDLCTAKPKLTLDRSGLGLPTGGACSILCSKEVALATILMQIVSVVVTGNNSAEQQHTSRDFSFGVLP